MEGAIEKYLLGQQEMSKRTINDLSTRLDRYRLIVKLLEENNISFEEEAEQLPYDEGEVVKITIDLSEYC